MSDQSGPEQAKLRQRLGFGVSDLVPDPSAMSVTQAHLDDLALLERWRAHRTGLAPYYPLLYSLVIGMGAQRVFEFGTGESTKVLHAALKQTGGVLVSCCPPDACSPFCEHDAMGGVIKHDDHWHHYGCLSSQAIPQLGPEDIFDLVLHDGSHSADVVASDLLGILPRMRHGGLILIHDVLHSYVGEAMKRGIEAGACGAKPETLDILQITLPFAFGLMILQTYCTGNGPVSIGPEKASSPHHTVRIAMA